jgi:hypothetical protein
MSTPEPLWRVMLAAGDLCELPDDRPWDEHHVYAAELRAIADWLVPEEVEPDECDRAIRLRWLERQRIRFELLAEADRAEAGE